VNLSYLFGQRRGLRANGLGHGLRWADGRTDGRTAAQATIAHSASVACFTEKKRSQFQRMRITMDIRRAFSAFIKAFVTLRSRHIRVVYLVDRNTNILSLFEPPVYRRYSDVAIPAVLTLNLKAFRIYQTYKQ